MIPHILLYFIISPYVLSLAWSLFFYFCAPSFVVEDLCHVFYVGGFYVVVSGFCLFFARGKARFISGVSDFVRFASFTHLFVSPAFLFSMYIGFHVVEFHVFRRVGLFTGLFWHPLDFPALLKVAFC